ncbi:hypothetical protein [Parapedobacter sp. DT-150]|uniref:hypothetical protein n=1 Tax=Parapedobacter sp. DT-150 TaxID=3396162 RepID=UPI003F1E2A67
MERQLPIHHIGGTGFYVDVEAGEFREVLNPGNRIPFDELRFKGDHYELAFDSSTRGAYRGDLDSAIGRAHVSLVRIPRLFELDPEGMERKFAGWKAIANTPKGTVQQQDSTVDKRIR